MLRKLGPTAAGRQAAAACDLRQPNTLQPGKMRELSWLCQDCVHVLGTLCRALHVK